MTPRARRILIAILVVVVLLFAGRWTAGVLADRWWAEQISPAAGWLVAKWHLMELSLELTGIAVACAWFIGNLLGVYRAIRTVQVPRQLANLEIREALTPRLLVIGSVSVGGLLGLLVGSGVGNALPTALLAWQGVHYGEAESLLNYDLGLYVAQLPLWRFLHGYMLLLTLLALVGCLTLYVVIGSVRWMDGRPAISDHARRHLGILLAAFGLCLFWGYLLEPYEAVAGLHGITRVGLFRLNTLIGDILAGVAISATLLSALWAWRPRHALLAAGWIVLVTTSILGHHVLPAIVGQTTADALQPTARRHLESLAFGMTGIKDTALRATGAQPELTSAPAALWTSAIVADQLSSDSSEVLAADATTLLLNGHPRPVWLTVRAPRAGRGLVAALADDRVTPRGGPLYYQPGDSIPYPQPVTWLELSPYAAWPGAPDHLVDTVGRGVLVGRGLRRIALAWALQAGELFATMDFRDRVLWRLDPHQRLQQLTPFIEWSVPTARLVGSELIWVTDGYLSARTFPLVARQRWKGEDVGSVRAAFVGIVHAESGETHIYLRHNADALAEAWRDISGRVIEPAFALPPEIGRTIGYPMDLLRVQGHVLEGDHWEMGALAGRRDSTSVAVLRPEATWDEDTTQTQYLVPFEQGKDRHLGAVLEARMVDEREALRIVHFDSAGSLPSVLTLQSRWTRFPSFEQIRDSVAARGARWKEGPCFFWLGSTGMGVYQTYYGVGDGADPQLVWVSVAIGDRRGAGHSLHEAWQNLRGLTAPLVAAAGTAGMLEEAQRYLASADSALRKGDLAAFARAFDALKKALQPPKIRPK
ncbi:MAG: UPF0182 family protein [Gemmatimonadota bacterium]